MSNKNEVISDNVMSNEAKKRLVDTIYGVLSGVSYSNIEDILNSVRKKASENSVYFCSSSDNSVDN